MDTHSNEGLPAIQPHLSSVPTFAEEDVRDYVATHAVPGGSIKSATPPTVVAIRFMTTHEASALIQNFIGWRKDDLVCYVELEGLFTFHGGPPGYVSKHATIPVETRVYEILDARTGNLLVVGFLPTTSDD